jgi:hypothetical protein
MFVALLFLGAACSSGGGAGSGSGNAPSEGDTSVVILRVTRGGETLAEWSIDRVRAELTISTAPADGEDQEGPTLLDLLAASGVGRWTNLEVLGFGPQRSFEVGLDVEFDDVDEGWILDISRRGTLKLAADALGRERWVRDVTEIRIGQ